MRILVVNGPNLDRLGSRQPHIYGTATLAEIERIVTERGQRLGVEVSTFQSNHEGEIIERIHLGDYDGMVINPGALTHTSQALADAIRSTSIPTVELHISNIKEREPWRAVSLLEAACVRTIYGRGVDGYIQALRHLVNRAAVPFAEVRYGPHPQNVGDLRRGAGALVVLVHGGFWRHEYGRDTMESVAVDLTRRGHTTWTIEYRRIGAGGSWPASGHDMLTALDFVPQLDLAETPLSVIGHSAGGYLGMWAGPRSRSRVALIVSLAPVVDLTALVSRGAVGAPEASTLLDRGAPPKVDPRPISTIAVHGERDEIVPISHSRRLAAETGAELLESGEGHFELLDPSRPHWPRVVERLAP